MDVVLKTKNGEFKIKKHIILQNNILNNFVNGNEIDNYIYIPINFKKPYFDIILKIYGTNI